MPPKIRYDREDDVLMIWFAENAQVDHAEQQGNAIVHMTENGQVILLEILEAQNFVVELVRQAITGTAESPV